MLFSFIITRYNQDITKAVESILYSGIPKYDYEIIVCDDLSDTPYVPIANEKIVHGRGRNKSYNRNQGIRAAEGEYLVFVDGDDYFNTVGLYHVYGIVLNFCGFNLFCQRYLKQVRGTTDFDLKRSEIGTFLHGTHSYIVNREYLMENDLYWDEDKHNFYWEDMYFGIRLHDNTESIMYMDNEWLTYHKLEGATTSDFDIYSDNIIAAVSEIIQDLRPILKTEKAMQHLNVEEQNIYLQYTEKLRREIQW